MEMNRRAFLGTLLVASSSPMRQLGVSEPLNIESLRRALADFGDQRHPADEQRFFSAVDRMLILHYGQPSRRHIRMVGEELSIALHGKRRAAHPPLPATPR
jgi:hypothetical protein